jgi:succinyl-CoA synthetase alpha subunit
MIKANAYVKERNALIGPNCPGVTPGEAKVGIMPGLYLKEKGLYLNQEL